MHIGKSQLQLPSNNNNVSELYNITLTVVAGNNLISDKNNQYYYDLRI